MKLLVLSVLFLAGTSAHADLVCFDHTSVDASKTMQESKDITFSLYTGSGEKRATLSLEKLGAENTGDRELDVTYGNQEPFALKAAVNIVYTRPEKYGKYQPDEIVLNGDRYGLKPDLSATEKHTVPCFNLKAAPVKFVEADTLEL